ncbi:uncharacterized protein FIBRA_08094 [Fibroporia radiculosa]|uniref:Uncharacterized protein n=1 Tax=Fibroporia radiculosa TaxID=599839 RepID=J4GGF6_9APHY|nr:uncharacterized protein FIBRA_08094 [Fibroporia radiculosa]CCM05858.1 predicted protein [Fibroporia radiculosa]
MSPNSPQHRRLRIPSAICSCDDILLLSALPSPLLSLLPLSLPDKGACRRPPSPSPTLRAEQQCQSQFSLPDTALPILTLYPLSLVRHIPDACTPRVVSVRKSETISSLAKVGHDTSLSISVLSGDRLATLVRVLYPAGLTLSPSPRPVLSTPTLNGISSLGGPAISCGSDRSGITHPPLHHVRREGTTRHPRSRPPTPPPPPTVVVISHPPPRAGYPMTLSPDAGPYGPGGNEPMPHSPGPTQGNRARGPRSQGRGVTNHMRNRYSRPSCRPHRQPRLHPRRHIRPLALLPNKETSNYLSGDSASLTLLSDPARRV